MKLIKAFVRRNRIDDVLWKLQDAGAPGVTISKVHGVGYGYKRHLEGLAPNDLSKTEEVCKVEIVCLESSVESLVQALIDSARTGFRGDGIVFVTPVEHAVRIRTGEEGPRALKKSDSSPKTAS